MPTVEALLTVAIARLRASGSESARLDAEVLLGHVVGIDRTAIAAHPEAPVSDAAAERFDAAVARREAGEPVAYIRGVKEFHGLAFGTDPRALIPRPETELLVELAIGEIVRVLTLAPRPAGTPPLRVADVGTGTGAVAIAIAVELRKRGMLDDVSIDATDESAEAVQLARENAVAHAVADRVEFEVADLLPGRAMRPWDVVAANLPYVRTGDLASLPRATSFEPVRALDGGPDGLTLIGRLVDQLPAALAPTGAALLEIGADQEPEVLRLVGERLSGWSVEVRRDLAGRPRVVRLARPPASGSAGGGGMGA
jgi:release factor glutamine methyltransferase